MASSPTGRCSVESGKPCMCSTYMYPLYKCALREGPQQTSLGSWDLEFWWRRDGGSPRIFGDQRRNRYAAKLPKGKKAESWCWGAAPAHADELWDQPESKSHCVRRLTHPMCSCSTEPYQMGEGSTPMCSSWTCSYPIPFCSPTLLAWLFPSPSTSVASSPFSPSPTEKGGFV